MTLKFECWTLGGTLFRPTSCCDRGEREQVVDPPIVSLPVISLASLKNK